MQHTPICLRIYSPLSLNKRQVFFLRFQRCLLSKLNQLLANRDEVLITGPVTEIFGGLVGNAAFLRVARVHPEVGGLDERRTIAPIEDAVATSPSAGDAQGLPQTWR